MELDDRLVINTPEGVRLELTLAGLGSRATASLLDSLIKLGIALGIAGLVALLPGPGPDSAQVLLGLAAVGALLLLFGYDIAFETFNSGRTPGKTAAGIRVVAAGGGPIGFVAASVRNVLRIIDFLPTSYAIGLIAIIFTAKNQRLGDLAANALVIRERSQRRPTYSAIAAPPAPEPGVAAWDVTGISAHDVAVARRFLDRRAALDPLTRERLAVQIAGPLRAKVVGAAEGLSAEQFLDRLIAEKTARE